LWDYLYSCNCNGSTMCMALWHKIAMKLNDLPILPEDRSLVFEAYTQECRAINTREDLIAFIKRWKTLWDTDNSTLEESKLIAGTFDTTEVLRCLSILKAKKDCEHTKVGKPCVASHVILPMVLLKSFLIAKQYGVPHDVALVQIYGGYEEIDVM